MDTAGVQLLVAAAQEAARRQRPLHLRKCPPALREAVRSLGLASCSSR
ncbi:MAG: STAS domain-containing protein [Steroidobacteraceae bacterium]